MKHGAQAPERQWLRTLDPTCFVAAMTAASRSPRPPRPWAEIPVSPTTHKPKSATTRAEPQDSACHAGGQESCAAGDLPGQHRDSTTSQIPHFSHEPSWLNHAVFARSSPSDGPREESGIIQPLSDRDNSVVTEAVCEISSGERTLAHTRATCGSSRWSTCSSCCVSSQRLPNSFAGGGGVQPVATASARGMSLRSPRASRRSSSASAITGESDFKGLAAVRAEMADVVPDDEVERGDCPLARLPGEAADSTHLLCVG